MSTKLRKVKVDVEGGFLIYFYEDEPKLKHVIKEEDEFVHVKDLKSAVQKLLKEVEKLDQIELEEFTDEKLDARDVDEILSHAVDYFKFLLRQTFKLEK